MGRVFLALFGLAVVLPLQAADPAGTAAGQPAAVPVRTAVPNEAPKAAVAARKQPGQVTQAVFTTSIQNLEPANSISTLTNNHRHIYFFTDLRHMTGQTITHRWVYKGKVMAEVKFQVGGPRWRVYSRKTLDPAWLGEWQASVVDASGITLGVSTFEYAAAAKPPAAPAARPAQGAAAPVAPRSSQ